MFEKFTERARRVMNIARVEAQRLNSEFIGTEHILLGIVQEGGGVAAKVLKNLSVDLRSVRNEIERLLQPSPTPTVTLGHLPFSPRAKRVLELAQTSATQLGHDVIGTEHLLLGLLKENEGIAAMVLQNVGVRLNEVHDMVFDLLGADVLPAPESSASLSETWMFIKFTTRSRNVLDIARAEARRLKSESIGTEHLLLGIMQEVCGVAARVLRDLGVDFDRARNEIERLQPGESSAPGNLVFSPAARRALELADETAGQLGHHVIDTGHLLLGLLRQTEGVAALVLSGSGVRFTEAHDKVLKLLGTEPAPPPPKDPPSTYTESARTILDIARSEARRLNCDFIGTEHLLLGLLKEKEGIAAMVLQNVGVRLNEVHDRFIEALGVDVPAPPKGEDLFTKVKKLFVTSKLPGASPMFDKIGNLRSNLEALNILIAGLLRSFQQLEDEAANDAAKAELAALRARIVELIEEWRGRVSGE